MENSPNKNEMKDRKIATVGTVSFFSVLFVLFLIFGFVTPLPLPEEGGIEVILGDVNVGMDIPAPKLAPKVPETNPSPKPSSKPVAQDNKKVETQNTEDAPVITPDENPTETSPQETPTETQNTQTTDQTTNDNQTENTEPERQSNKDYELTGDLFSQGDDNKEGVKGNPKGKTTGVFAGNPGIGWNLDLGGRGLMKDPPPIQAQYNKTEKVVLEITVDKKGNVINVKPRCKGATVVILSISW
jgi:colicin import membrane protein